ncbi:MAG: protein phosphatase 2C domain-containing protein [Thermodesulfobacteriota bacterium]
MALVIEAAGLTDVGRKRKGNEDSLFIDAKAGLFVVADGMGGHLAGEVASRVVVDTMSAYLSRFGTEENPEELSDADQSLSKEANRILASIKLANRAVHEMASKKEAYTGMGSTVSAIYVTDDGFISANVGDSPIYLLHQGALEPVYVPHTVIAEQTAMDPEGASRLGDKFSHMLTRAMGVEPDVKPDLCELSAYPGDVLVIASDGLTNMVSEEDIKRVVLSEKPDRAVHTLVGMANANGGEDNITVIVIKVKRVLSGGNGFMALVSRVIDFFKS